jgi:hypothetical protein
VCNSLARGFNVFSGRNRRRNSLLRGWEIFVEELAIGVALGDAAFLGCKLQSIFAIEFGLVHEFVDARGEGLRGVGLGAGSALFRGTNH